MHPDIAPGAQLSLWPQVATQYTQITLALMAEWPSDTKMAPGGGADPWHLPGLLCLTFLFFVSFTSCT